MSDAVNYLDWVVAWPSVVQAVRSLEDGTLPCDIEFVPGDELPRA